MTCWRCKHQMPDGLKYCGHCGVRMNRVAYAFEWLFSRKGLPVLLVILALLVGGLAWWLIPKLTLPAINIDFDLDMGLYLPDDDDIVYSDESKSYGYVSNMILIFFTRDATPEQIGQIVAEMDGEVMGIMPGVNQYQVKVTTRTEEELEALREQLMTYDVVKNAVIDYVSTVEGETIPNDPWDDPSGQNAEAVWSEETPSGANWWPEAVNLLSAWEYGEYFGNIKVGIADNGFDTAHEDLNITVINEALNSAEGHGTHAAGIIAATHNNGLGISGVLENVTLYGVDCFATEQQSAQRVTISSLLGGIDLCLSQGCRVVNMSAGLSYDYVMDNPAAVRNNARETVEYLIMMLDYAQEDFLIVKSAGNAGVDAHTYNGYFSSIDEELVREVLAQMKTDGVKLEKEITVEDVMNSFLVVGAVDYPDQGYRLADFSNFGDSVTICAPGVHILSTIPSGSEYGFKNGTSMAAPNMSGMYANLLSAIYEINEDMGIEMTKAEVAELAKDLIHSTADLVTDEYGYHYSPRKQGAGLASSWNAIANYVDSAYITNPLQELGDDPEKTGVYKMSIELKNSSEFDLLYSDFETYVMYDYLLEAPNGTIVNSLTTEYAYLKDDATTAGYGAGASVTYTVNGTEITEVVLAAGESVTIDVTVTLNDAQKAYFDAGYPNGAFVEGYVVFNEYYEGQQYSSAHATFMAYYGDWTQAPIFDTAYWYDNSFWGYESATGLPEGLNVYYGGGDAVIQATGSGLVKPGILSMDRLIDLLVINPRKRFGIDLGCDYSIWDLEAEYAIDPEEFLSMGKATPLAGWVVNGKCMATVCDGKVVYKA